MAVEAQFRCDVSGPEALAALRDAALPPRLRGGAPSRSFHRDIYLDTNDRALLARGVSCRVRIRADDRRQVLEGTSDPARRLRGLVDPALLRPKIELEVERWSRIALSGLIRREPR